MTEILIVNFTSRLNKGSAALLSSKIQLLRGLSDEVYFTVTTRNPEIGYSRHNVKIEKVIGTNFTLKMILGELILSVLLGFNKVFSNLFGRNLNLEIRGIKLLRFIDQYSAKTLFIDALSSSYAILLLIQCGFWSLLNKIGLDVSWLVSNKRLQVYRTADIVINTGGDCLTEDYGTPISHFGNLLFAMLLNKPVVICAESLGPFKNRWNLLVATFILNRSKLITVREELSLKYLQDIGVNKPPIHLTADVAFVLESSSKLRINEILKKEGTAGSMPLIGVSVSKIISKYGFPELRRYEDKYDAYVKLMSKVIDYLMDTFNATIVFVPHVIGPGENLDDRTVADDIYKFIKHREKCISINEDYTPEELKGIIGVCDLFIGARMHSTIASTSMLVPTVAIAYSNKTHGIIGKMLGYENYILDIKDLNYESLISKVNDVWENRGKIKKELEVKIPLVKEKAMLNGKLVKEVVDTLKTS